MRAPVFVLEGAWENPHEAPQVLPYLIAYANSHREINLQHRTFRCLDDIAYYVSKVPRGARAFFYFACHGEEGYLVPADGRSKIAIKDIEEALGRAKEESIGFIHFGCCDFVRSSSRRQTLSKLINAPSAGWISGYASTVDWLPSTLLDIALINDVYVPWFESQGKYTSNKVNAFFKNYEQLARNLAFSAMYRVQKGERLFPGHVLAVD